MQLTAPNKAPVFWLAALFRQKILEVVGEALPTAKTQHPIWSLSFGLQELLVYTLISLFKTEDMFIMRNCNFNSEKHP